MKNHKPHSRHKQSPFESSLISFVASLCLFFIWRVLLLLTLNVCLHIGHEYDDVKFKFILVLHCSSFTAVVLVEIFASWQLLHDSCWNEMTLYGILMSSLESDNICPSASECFQDVGTTRWMSICDSTIQIANTDRRYFAYFDGSERYK